MSQTISGAKFQIIMLQILNIKNLLLIDSAELEFTNGFNAITGETGAGKSILLDCLSLCLGEKNSGTQVKNPEEKGYVTAYFDISENNRAQELIREIGLDESDELIIKRTLSGNGKSQAYINDEPVSLNSLKKISNSIIEIYGQHDFSTLVDKSFHIEILDQFGEHEELLKNLHGKYFLLKEAEAKLQEIRSKADEAAREEEFTRFVVKELAAFNPRTGEEQELNDKRITLTQSSKIKEAIFGAESHLTENNVLQNIYASQKQLSKTAATIQSEDIKNKLQNVHNTLEKSVIELEDAIEQLNDLNSIEDFNTDNLEKIEDRLFGLRELARKYRKTPDELAEYLLELENKLKLIESFDDILQNLKNEKAKAENEYLQIAKRLSDKRVKASQYLEKEVNLKLPELKMQGTKFKVEISSKESEHWNDSGIDKIIFTASTNPGQPFTEIGKTASGGELSRLMLALKVALTKSRSASCVIFDEIDTGIGGATAEAVGNSLAQLGACVQVIAVTHQPQVASKASDHFKVLKMLDKNQTKVSAKKLNAKESNEEIARMIAGENITKEARAAALKLKIVN